MTKQGRSALCRDPSDPTTFHSFDMWHCGGYVDVTSLHMTLCIDKHLSGKQSQNASGGGMLVIKIFGIFAQFYIESQ